MTRGKPTQRENKCETLRREKTKGARALITPGGPARRKKSKDQDEGGVNVEKVEKKGGGNAVGGGTSRV